MLTPECVKMFSIGYVLVLQSQLHHDDAWRQRYFEWCVCVCVGVCAIHSLKPRTAVVFVVEGCFDEFCYPGCSRGILLGMNLPILLAMVSHGKCVSWHCHAEKMPPVTLISGTT